MGGINIKKSEALEILSKKIQCDIFWNSPNIQWLSFLRQGKNFRSFFSSHHLHPKENCIQLSCVCRGLKFYFEVNDWRVSNSIDSLKHRCNLVCVSLSHRYYKVFFLSKIMKLIAVNHVFLCNSRLSWQADSLFIM